MAKRGGHNKRPNSLRSIAKKADMPVSTMRKLERRVTIAESFPFLQRRGWSQNRIVKAGELMQRLPAREQQLVSTLLDRDGISPADAVEGIRNLLRMAPERRKTILGKSPEEAFRLAITVAPSDPSLQRLRNATRELLAAQQLCKVQEFSERIFMCALTVRHLLEDFEQYDRDGISDSD